MCDPILSVLPFCFASFPFPYLSLFLSIGQKRQLQIGVDASSYINLPLYFLSLPLFSFFHFTTHHLAYFPSLRGISFFKLLNNLKELEFPSTSPISLAVQVITHLADFLSSFQLFLFFFFLFILYHFTDHRFIFPFLKGRESHSCLTSGLSFFYFYKPIRNITP